MSHVNKNLFRPSFDALEDRTVPTTAILNNGILEVIGTKAADNIILKQTATKISVSGVKATFDVNKVQAIRINGLAGNDTIDASAVSKHCEIHGGLNNDRIVGSSVTDTLFGEEGNDRIFGKGGSDIIYGGSGNDLLFGDGDLDFLFGESDNDFLDDGNRLFQEIADGGSGKDWNADVMFVSGMSMEDIDQQASPTCSLLASIAGLAGDGYNFSQQIRYNGYRSDGTPTYQVKLWQNNAWQWRTVNFDGTVTSNDPGVSSEGESWVILLQRAWIQQKGGTGSCFPHEAILALTGKTAKSQYSVANKDFYAIQNALAGNQLVVSATNVKKTSTTKLVTNHSYTVIAAFGFETPFIDSRFVVVRNPWGVDGGSGSGNVNDGYITLTWKEFQSSMRYLSIA